MSTQCTFITRMQSIYGTHALIQRCKWPLDVSFFLFISSCYIHIPVRIPNESSKKAFISCIISLELFSYCSLFCCLPLNSVSSLNPLFFFVMSYIHMMHALRHRVYYPSFLFFRSFLFSLYHFTI